MWEFAVRVNLRVNLRAVRDAGVRDVGVRGAGESAGESVGESAGSSRCRSSRSG